MKKSRRQLYLYFPQWQGSGKTDEIRRSAEFVLRHIKNTPFKKVPLSSLADHNGKICSREAIIAQHAAANEIIRALKPVRIFTLGGDCGVELAPVSYLNKLHRARMGVVWLDAHGDLNTPESSPSRLFHGMPLRTLIGEGDDHICDSLFSKLHPSQIVLVGTRALDAPEKACISRKTIKRLAGENAKKTIALLKTHFMKAGIKKIYLHLDTDVIDPADFPYVKCPTPNGVPYKAVQALLSGIAAEFEIVGASLLEHCLSPAVPLSGLNLILDLWNALTP